MPLRQRERRAVFRSFLPRLLPGHQLSFRIVPLSFVSRGFLNDGSDFVGVEIHGGFKEFGVDDLSRDSNRKLEKNSIGGTPEILRHCTASSGETTAYSTMTDIIISESYYLFLFPHTGEV